MSYTYNVEISNYNSDTEKFNKQLIPCTIVKENTTSYNVKLVLNGEEKIIRKKKSAVFLMADQKDEIQEVKTDEKKKEHKQKTKKSVVKK